ncbi:hypothetical protein Pan241w_13420 [Gimesia alba]|uniref:Uncharacterized protein n=1 Tax=Gimesia alba TaxID=2527973 RepID=A0A517RBN5_9PLAN|nr:hypothetical protein Pan241w_13420 [Gimesia alba]
MVESLKTGFLLNTIEVSCFEGDQSLNIMKKLAKCSFSTTFPHGWHSFCGNCMCYQ